MRKRQIRALPADFVCQLLQIAVPGERHNQWLQMASSYESGSITLLRRELEMMNTSSERSYFFLWLSCVCQPTPVGIVGSSV